ncbi:YihY/virulence factor BrkB family protein [Xylanimonas ulmi]|uniref:Membrane protein n=1 Tax=Xylanimonas ulmi TaxID=228973 RepID=A0A4Q7M2P2_9MICO|nr:YihY/virulence factor BrkB family protein [Xylanibacterium ulmi]RZS61744.1 membrane protein [Xylanibacterium ulmi]
MLPAAVTRAVDWWKSSRPGRSLAWYGARNGAQLCGGVAYSALFSLFAALTIGWSVFSASLGSNAQWRGAVLDQMDTWVPGLVGTGPGDLVSPDDLILHGGSAWTTVVAAVVLLLSALGVMGALRTSVRAVFDIPPTQGNAVVARLWQLVGFVLLGVGVLVSAAASIAAHSVGEVVESLLGGSEAAAWVVRVGGAAVGIVLDALVVAGIVVLLGGARPGRRDLVLGCLAVGAVAGALRWAGTSLVVGSAGRNALLAPFAAIVTILVLVNFLARMLLLVCAWMHDPPRLDADAG